MWLPGNHCSVPTDALCPDGSCESALSSCRFVQRCPVDFPLRCADGSCSNSTCAAVASGGLSEWSLYGALIGVFLGLAGWLGWKKYRERQQSPAIDEDLIEFPELEIDPKRDEEHEDSDGIDLRVEPSAMGLPIQVDVELDGGEHAQAQDVGHPVIAPSHWSGRCARRLPSRRSRRFGCNR